MKPSTKPCSSSTTSARVSPSRRRGCASSRSAMRQRRRTSGRRHGPRPSWRRWAGRSSAASMPMRRLARLYGPVCGQKQRRRSCSRPGSRTSSTCRAASRSSKRCRPLTARRWLRNSRAAGMRSAPRLSHGSSPCCAARSTRRCEMLSRTSARPSRRAATRPRRSSRMPATAIWPRRRHPCWKISGRAARPCAATST